MYRFIFFTDLHADNRLFLARKDSFESACLDKLNDLAEASNRLDCDVVCGGDLINQPYLGHAFINKIIDILKKFKRPLNLVLGNHDIIGRNLDSYNSSTLGLLKKANVISIMSRPGLVEDYMIVPFPYNEDQTSENYRQTYTKFFPGDYDIDRRPRLIITHNMVLPKPAIFNHILSSDVAKVVPSKSIFLVGHYHVPFSCIEDDVKFINIGSAGRVSRSPGENRIPEYAIITISGSDVDIDRRRFPSAKPWDTVFEPKSDNKTNNTLIDAKDFFNSYEDKSLDLNDIMTSLAEKMHISKEIVEESKIRLEKARHRVSLENNKYG